jgi:hypothetical protein
MKQRADARRWAAAWLAGITRAIKQQRMAPSAQDAVLSRVRLCGLTNSEIDAILKNPDDPRFRPSRPRPNHGTTPSPAARRTPEL